MIQVGFVEIMGSVLKGNVNISMDVFIIQTSITFMSTRRGVVVMISFATPLKFARTMFVNQDQELTALNWHTPGPMSALVWETKQVVKFVRKEKYASRTNASKNVQTILKLQQRAEVVSAKIKQTAPKKSFAQRMESVEYLLSVKTQHQIKPSI